MSTWVSSSPSHHFIGFLINAGTRDEISATSGSCLALKNTYLKTLKHTNETINYGMIQMSGGSFTMDYDQERMYFKGHCIEYDVSDMFQMMVDCALEPRSVLSANVARSKNAKSHELADHLAHFDPFMSNNELLMRTAYGYNTLGMPHLGTQGGVDNIDARSLQQFMMENITPKKCLIVASGIHNHNEFVELVKERIGEILPVPEHAYERKASEYIGGEYRAWSESPQTSITLGFENCAWGSSDVATSFVMQQLIGSASSHHKNKPGNGRYNRATENLILKHNFVDSAHAINHHFSDSGLFGIQVEGPGAHSADLMKVGCEELNNLTGYISDAELSRAKNILKMSVASCLDNQGDRLEEMARNYMSHGELNFHHYADKIDSVTADDVNRHAAKLLEGKPTLLVTGGAINLVPSVSDVQRMLN
jgi:predicted Zn-dependent peptidase